MGYASRSGHARTSTKKPEAFGRCFRCSRWFNRNALQFQHDWRGTSIVNLWILVCEDCYDVPQEQLRALQLPADPTPVWFPSVEQFEADETDYRSTLPIPVHPIVGIPIPAATALRVTEDCRNRITQPIGEPDGLVQEAVMPYNGGVQKAFGVPLPLLSVTANGTAMITVTCYQVHGLQPNDQVSVEGLSDGGADGFYSVQVPTATVFTYTTPDNVPAGSLLAPTTRIVTARVGLPYGSATIPAAGS
jgi:hypothetical protein